MQAARRALGPERVSRTHVSVKRYQIKQLKEKGNFSHRFSILPPSLKMTVWGDCFGMGSKRKKYPWGSCNERRGNAPPHSRWTLGLGSCKAAGRKPEVLGRGRLYSRTLC